ncbi:hypothetical protein KEM55_000215 [Ascosphaera atra]|nr:hypothetical protein KEM55_000215 [Ascosphaera atra]
MFALTFFGILHVPINVPALGISTGEDNLNVDQELIAHGPVIIGYIPIMVVGALIYMLGIELMEEALVDTWGKLHKLEYATVVVIIVTMGAFDFVQGIVAGIILACVSFVVQTSRKSAITATYTGEVASSTVRRHPMHVRFLREAGRQTSIVKLTGFLFFGTIVDVESCIRGLIDEKAFSERPIRYLVLDFWRVNGLDFSAAEAFTRLHRILSKRGVHMIICGLDLENDVGTSLQNVGLFSGPGQVKLFENLNSALEFCENELLKALHNRRGSTKDVPRATATPGVPVLSEGMFNSPRDLQLHQVAQETLQEEEGAHPSVPERYSTFPQPLALLLQTFQGLTKENEDFWWNAVPYFHRATFSMNAVLFRQKDLPEGFYLLESGMLRAEYETPQGKYDELIVAGRCCGELPFFGETPRSATMRAECDCVVWVLDRKNWDELRAKEPMIAQELLRVCLKLTSERMESITSYVLTTT